MPQEKINPSSLLAAIAIGAGCMYLLDPVNGRRRRTRIRDKFVRLSHAVENEAGTAARDLTNRTWGLAASTARLFYRAQTDDAVLEPRVRSEMGRWVSYPHAIHIEAGNGRITLSGDILASEQTDLIRHISNVPGVKEVENQLRVHESGENFPVRKNGVRGEPRFELFQTHWAPGPRLLVIAAGAAMVAGGIRQRGISGLGTVAGGTLVLVRAIANREMMRLLGFKKENRGADAEKSSESGVSIPITRREPKEYRIH